MPKKDRTIRTKRRLRRNKIPTEKQSSSERVSRTAVSFIEKMRSKQLLIEQIRRGTPLGQIADFFTDRGLVDVNRRTFLSYLQYYRKAHPEECTPRGPNDWGKDSTTSYDHLFDGAFLVTDEETELLKLIELQKSRVAIDYRTETSINKLFASTNKEVQVLGELLEKLAKIRGRSGPKQADGGPVFDAETKSDLKEIETQENKREILTNLTQQLLDVSSG